MNEKAIILEGFQKLEKYVSRENYTGWDPYDALIAKRIPRILLNNKIFAMSLIQLNLYSPINLRPLLKIEKGKSNKALALFSRAYYIASGSINEKEFKQKARKLLFEVVSRTTPENCHSHYFNSVSFNSALGPGISDIICLTETIKSLVVAYSLEKEPEFLSLALKRLNFIFNHLFVEKGEIAYFKYTPIEKGKIVFNVSSLALESLAELKNVCNCNLDEFVDKGKRVVNFLLLHQRSDGAWPYSIYTDKNKYYWQIDFHQGFIIDGLTAFLPYLDEDLKKKTEEALMKGVEFYINRQFTKEGYSFYRYPVKYPIDIHNQAQGIITFSKLYKAFGDERYLDFAKKIALWTIKNMQSPEGYFYSHKWPFFVNKIPYMRWGQAWMMLALATLLEVLSK